MESEFARMKPRYSLLARTFAADAAKLRHAARRNPDLWTAPDSPWAPLFIYPFVEGLTKVQRSAADAAAKNRDCAAVMTWIWLGASKLHSALSEAYFYDEFMVIDFENQIAPRLSLALRRCHALRVIHETLERSERESFGIKLIWPDLPTIHISDSRPPQRKSWTPYWHAVRDLGSLALCHDYLPAFEDLGRLSQQHRVVITDPVTSYYMILRAQRLGSAITVDHPLMTNAVEQYGEPIGTDWQNLKSMEAAMAHDDLEDAARVMAFELRICKEPVPVHYYRERWQEDYCTYDGCLFEEGAAHSEESESDGQSKN